MTKSKNHSKVFLISIMLLVVIGFTVNWFLTYRLESFLRKELKERVADATGGFYNIDFNKLYVGLFDGELTIENLVLKPDSAIFKQWALNDSLPSTYADVTIGRIHFKGVNLTWRISYKELNFELFEVNTPFVNIYDSSDSDKITIKNKNTGSNTLYDLISRYINVLTVKKMNLANASVSYTTSDQDSPTIYALKNVSFHAYGFRLDKYSYQRGNLLYCDDFDFTTNEPQTLLSNNQFILNADTIRLNTSDSIIQINKIALIPQKMLWAQLNQIPDSYLEASVKSLKIEGLNFRRENARNYLKSRRFNISSSDIQYFVIQKDSLKQIKRAEKPRVESAKVIDQSWSLYKLTSPLFESICIEKVGIKDAQLAYSFESDEGTDFYKLAKFNFEAQGFRVDSLSAQDRKFLYSDVFNLEATDINGTVESRNHIFSVNKMFLNTQTGYLDVGDIVLSPITTKTKSDYIKGSINSICLTGLEYKNGLKAESFVVNRPQVEYVKMPARLKHYVLENKIDTVVKEAVVLDFIAPYFGFVSVKDIRLNDGNLIFNDRRDPTDIMIYRLPQIDFHATNVILNQQTIREAHAYVRYDDFDFRFKRFDNLLPGKQYRLSIDQGFYSGWGGDLQLKGLKLVPEENKEKEAPEVFVSLNIPSLKLEKVLFGVEKNKNLIKSKFIDVVSPQVRIIKVKDGSGDKYYSQEKNKIGLHFGVLKVSEAGISYQNRVSKKNIDFSTRKFLMKSFVWNTDQKLMAEEIVLDTPLIDITDEGKINKEPDRDTSSSDRFSIMELIDIRKLKIAGLQFNIDRPSMKIQTEVPVFSVNNIEKSNSSFNIQGISLIRPIVKINQEIEPGKSENSGLNQFKDRSKDGFYNTIGKLGKHLSLGKLDVENAQINYSNKLNGQSITTQEINSTNFDLVGLTVDTEDQKLNIDDFNFMTSNLHFPVDNGFYTMKIGEIDVHKKDQILKLSQLRLVSSYPKEQFAYRHPKHKDWFDVSVGNIVFSGIDYPRYFLNKKLDIKYVKVEDVDLMNYKNQQITIAHNVMPMIYEGLQKAPLKFNVDKADVNNFNVSYEELPKKGEQPGRIFFTNMNGRIDGLTNIVTKPQQYTKLDADGKLMGTGYFTASWYLPVDSLNDRFLLTANLREFNLTDLNQLITPMAPIKINQGVLTNLLVKTEASSRKAKVQMRFLYNGLNVTVFKDTENGYIPNKLYTNLANTVLKRDNPDRKRKKPREPFLSLERDPYHSTFNYIWQILQPPLIESVGVSQNKQNFVKKVGGFISKVKKIFKGSPNKEILTDEKKD